MEAIFHHVPVLAAEVIEALRPASGGRYLDGTLGGGGHAEIILKASSPGGKLWGTDRDECAIAAASSRLAAFGDRVEICLLYTSPSPRDRTRSRMPSSA